jgi:hypothetical protein
MANPQTFEELLNETYNMLEAKGAEAEEEERKRKNKNRKNKAKKQPEKEPAKPSEEESLIEDFQAADPFGLGNLNLDNAMDEEDEDFEIPSEDTKAEITNPVSFDMSPHKIGESVSKEFVEELERENKKPKDGYKATVIIHTRTIVENGSDDTASYDKPSQEELPSPLEVPSKPASAADRRIVRLDTGEVYHIKGVMSIGRDEDNDIVIPEPEGHYVSGMHATIELDSRNRLKLCDREGGSTNGTYVNNIKIASRYLKPGDKICFANVDFLVPED